MYGIWSVCDVDCVCKNGSTERLKIGEELLMCSSMLSRDKMDGIIKIGINCWVFSISYSGC